MGKIKQGTFGGFLGKVGNLIGSSWRGIAYIRIKPASVADPKTPKQLLQRNRFYTVVRFLRPFREFLRIGYRPLAVGMTALNAASSQVLREAVEGDEPDVMVNLPAVKVSSGGLPPALGAACASSEAGKVTVTWVDDTELSEIRKNHTAMVVVFCPDLNDVQYKADAGRRHLGEATVTLPGLYSGKEVHVWLSFATLDEYISTGDGSHISDSVYAGAVVVA